MERVSSLQNKSSLYAALVWIVSALFLLIYGALGFFDIVIPGVEGLVSLLASIEGTHLYLVAFIVIFLEGLYLIGSFFPGSSMVVVLAIVSQFGGIMQFIITILAIFFGWCLAGLVNIYGAKYLHTYMKSDNNKDVVHGQGLLTWFPAFRANHEVAQVTEGKDLSKVLISALVVRFWASVFMGIVVLIIPFFFSVNEITNEEGFVSVVIVAGIMLVVGTNKMRLYFKSVRKV